MSGILASASGCCDPCQNGVEVQVSLDDLILQQMEALVVDNFAELRALSSEPPFVNVLGSLAAGDDGGGLYYWDAISTAVDDGQDVIQPTHIPSGNAGRYIAYVRSNTTPFSLKWFGAKGVGTNDTTALLLAFNYARTFGVKLYAPKGVYGVTQELVVDWQSFVLQGEGPLNSVIKYIGTTPAASVLHIKHFGSNTHGFYATVTDIAILANVNCTASLKVTRMAHSHFTRVTAQGAGTYNLYCDGIVLCHFSDVSTSATLGLVASPVPYCTFITGVGVLHSNSNVFTNHIMEGATVKGLVLEKSSSQNQFNGGTVEAGKGILIDTGSHANTFINVDCEQNSENDVTMTALCNFNQFNGCLFDNGVRINGLLTSLRNCRIGNVLIDVNATGTWLENCSYGFIPAHSFTDNGIKTMWINRMDLRTAVVSDNRLTGTSSSWSVTAPLIVNSTAGSLYRFEIQERNPVAGHIVFDFVRYNSGAPTTTVMTFGGLFGRVGFNIPVMDDTDALVTIGGALQVGARRTGLQSAVGAIGFDTFLEGQESTVPTAPVVNRGRLFFQDNGAGKTQLAVRFNTGAVQILATEP